MNKSWDERSFGNALVEINVFWLYISHGWTGNVNLFGWKYVDKLNWITKEFKIINGRCDFWLHSLLCWGWRSELNKMTCHSRPSIIQWHSGQWFTNFSCYKCSLQYHHSVAQLVCTKLYHFLMGLSFSSPIYPWHVKITWRRNETDLPLEVSLSCGVQVCLLFRLLIFFTQQC